MIPRTLEPEVMETADEAMEYDSMDHSTVNRLFVEDLLRHAPIGRDLLDFGTGTALIPVALCLVEEEVRVMALDASVEMLELARYHLESHNMTQRIQLQFGDAKRMVFDNAFFDTVISNSIVHHIPDPIGVLSEAARVLRPGGLIFVRDLVRPDSEDAIESLVKLHASNESPYSQQLFRQSFHAALRLEEIQDLVSQLGFDPSSVSMSSDRHWTWVARKN